jgi:hypothetical protein
MTHELDNYDGHRLARVEYKRAQEGVPVGGQEKHFRAVLESVGNGWELLLVLVIDEGQTAAGQEARYRWRVSTKPRMTWGEQDYLKDSLDNLGRRIADWLWPHAAH